MSNVNKILFELDEAKRMTREELLAEAKRRHEADKRERDKERAERMAAYKKEAGEK